MGYYKKITIQPGDQYGDLIILERYGTAKNGQPQWKCKCLLCGNDNAIITSNKLRDKKNPKTNCGCQKHYKSYKEIPGTKYGKLTILKEDPIRAKDRKIKWVCQCDCGNIISVIGDDLRSGHTQSCGCINYSISEKRIADYLKSWNIPFKKEYNFSDLLSTNKARLRFDFAIKDNNDNLLFLIEYQGRQHFYESSLKDSFGKQQREETDLIKKEYCKSHNIKLYYINYNEPLKHKLIEILQKESLL